MAATLSVVDVAIDLGGKRILDSVSLTLAPGDRVGLVGRNGVGKSTLLRVISGHLQPDAGAVQVVPASANIGLLSQEHERRPGEVARDFLARRTGVADAYKQFEDAAEWLSTGDRSAEDHYANALERWLALGGADFEARVESIWHELGLKSEVLDHPMTALSGGEAARVGLAALLLSRFDIYMLDEPTNDLDIDGLDRLESFVLSKPVGQLIVSHDREFLKRVITRVVEIDEHTRRASNFFGGWSSYLTEKANTRRLAEQAYATYSTSRAQLEERARREREWTSKGVSRAKHRPSDNDSRRRKANRERSESSGASASRIQRALERLEVVEKPWEGWELRLEIATAPRSGSVVARLRGATVDRETYQLGPVDLEVHWAERIAIVGPNGSGKTTLLDALLGRAPLSTGERWIGPSVIFGEIDQARAQFEGGAHLLEVFLRSTGRANSEGRNILAKFGLGAEDVDRPSRMLSPGERTRASLALLQATGVNCLVLDEPTNHLDLPAIEQLEQALNQFPGTVLLVTHDREFLRSIRLERVITLRDGRIVADAAQTSA
jgi:ATPase subunit of ABC transporter with duplicated ATPase domains